MLFHVSCQFRNERCLEILSGFNMILLIENSFHSSLSQLVKLVSWMEITDKYLSGSGLEFNYMKVLKKHSREWAIINSSWIIHNVFIAMMTKISSGDLCMHQWDLCTPFLYNIQECLNVNENLSKLCGSKFLICLSIFIYIQIHMVIFIYVCISIYTSWKIDTKKIW